jgi:hypothetical protein
MATTNAQYLEALNNQKRIAGPQSSGALPPFESIYNLINNITGYAPTGQFNIQMPMYGQAGVVLAAFANGASAVPGTAIDGGEGAGIRWNNHAAPEYVVTGFTFPTDLNNAANATLHIVCWKTGATVGDATTFTVGLFNNVTGALYDADATYGGASSAITGDAATKTVQVSTLTLTAADLPSPSVKHNVSMTIKPTDGTLGTDDITIGALIVTYTKKSFLTLLGG